MTSNAIKTGKHWVLTDWLRTMYRNTFKSSIWQLRGFLNENIKHRSGVPTLTSWWEWCHGAGGTYMIQNHHMIKVSLIRALNCATVHLLYPQASTLKVWFVHFLHVMIIFTVVKWNQSSLQKEFSNISSFKRGINWSFMVLFNPSN